MVSLREFLKLFKYMPPAVSTRSLDGCISYSKLFTKREERREFSECLYMHLKLLIDIRYVNFLKKPP